MKWLLLEEFIPSDDKFVASSLSDSESRIYTPTEEFLGKAYSILNRRFFGSRLPGGIDFRISRDLKDNASGHTDGGDRNNDGNFTVNYISLNGTLMKTPHSWVETIIHEMIHVDDMVSHPEHFTEGYDGHGDWFRKQVERFRKHGFDVKENDMDTNVSTSTDDDEIKEILSKSIFMAFGSNPVSGATSVIKVAIEDKSLALDKLKGLGCSTATLLKTDNLNAARLNDIDVDNIGEFQYNINDRFNEKYGPFKEVETIDLSDFKVDESSQYGRKSRSTMTITRYPSGGIHVIT